MATQTPHFVRPPVAETVLSAEFAPLADWQVVHFGLFWERIRDEFPEYEVHSALHSQRESFGESRFAVSQPQLELVDVPDLRCWFVHRAHARLIQVQRDRLIQNWRRTSENEQYPRYHVLRPEFEKAWKRFTNFLDDNKIAAPAIHQAEISYINHIEIDRHSDPSSELAKYFRIWSGTEFLEFLPHPESGNFALQFAMPEESGRLRVTVQHGMRHADAHDVLVMTLTARGAPKGTGLDALLEWFDQGHEWIVRGFAELTSGTAHRLWGRQS